jgi:hypothetical protein
MERVMEDNSSSVALDIARGAKSISEDGPHEITDARRWLARQLLDSKLSDEEAFGIVAHHPAIRPTPDLLAALKKLERWATEDSDCHTQAQRMAGRKALIAARAAIAKAEGSPQ